MEHTESSETSAYKLQTPGSYPKESIQQQKTYFMSNNFFPENGALFDTMWKNIVSPGRPPIIMWRMRSARWIPKATDRHSEYGIFVTFRRQQYVREYAALLNFMYYITSFVNTKHISLSAGLVLIERKCFYQQFPYTQIPVLQSDQNKDWEDTHLLLSLFSGSDKYKINRINYIILFSGECWVGKLFVKNLMSDFVS